MARSQCWSWGGDLAFPLPDESTECSICTNYQHKEELWLAGPMHCSEARCVIPFDDHSMFHEGTYITNSSNDICSKCMEIGQGMLQDLDVL